MHVFRLNLVIDGELKVGFVCLITKKKKLKVGGISNVAIVKFSGFQHAILHNFELSIYVENPNFPELCCVFQKFLATHSKVSRKPQYQSLLHIT